MQRKRISELSMEELSTLATLELPLEFIKKKEICPIKVEDGKLLVAISSESSMMDAYALGAMLGMMVDIALADEEEIRKGIQWLYSFRKKQAQEAAKGSVVEDELFPAEREEILLSEEDAPIIELVNSILFRAVDDGASDIHIEPYREEMVVRYRIDGILSVADRFSRSFFPPVISRIKVMAGLDISEHLRPQDGRIGIKVGDRDVDIRVSVVPTRFGERVVLRLLYKDAGVMTLSDIGLYKEDEELFRNVLSTPYGMILLTGPTGSGKTTTLYAMLKELSTTEVNILTIEDPVEYELEGIGQIQVNRRAGMTFANGLRSILRQDPDILMVGEIRDRETAEIAIHAALTGHLVLSTLHTNDAPSAITRLVDMGIEPYLVSSSLLFVVAQRLVRKLCPYCKEKTEDGFCRGDGCKNCRYTGYLGRTGIFEYFVMDEELRRMVVKNQDASFLRNYLIKNVGMKTLKEMGMKKVQDGITTVEEVLRVTYVRL